jgi:hypothetical protein
MFKAIYLMVFCAIRQTGHFQVAATVLRLLFALGRLFARVAAVG